MLGNPNLYFGSADVANTYSHSEVLDNPHENMEVQPTSFKIKQEQADQEEYTPELESHTDLQTENGPIGNENDGLGVENSNIEVNILNLEAKNQNSNVVNSNVTVGNTDLNIEKHASDNETINFNNMKNSRPESFDFGKDIETDQKPSVTLNRQSEIIFYQGSQVCHITQNNFCHTCNKWFSSIDHLNEHMTGDEDSITSGKPSSSLDHSTRHEESHSANNIYGCELSHKDLESADKLQSKEAKMLSGNTAAHTDKRAFKCFCDREFASWLNLRRHLPSHTEKFKCSLCKHCFRNPSTLKAHMVTHSDERPFKCHVCEKDFKLKSYLKTHMVTHSAENHVKCGVCDKPFTLKSNLTNHMLTHSEERPFKCHVCGRGFKQKRLVKKHMLAHSNIRPFKCTVCDKGFKGKDDLKRHMSSHSDERPFKCTLNLCEKRFKEKNDLKKHMLTHTDERPFKCNVCDKGFKENVVLKRHLLTHPVNSILNAMRAAKGTDINTV